MQARKENKNYGMLKKTLIKYHGLDIGNQIALKNVIMIVIKTQLTLFLGIMEQIDTFAGNQQWVLRMCVYLHHNKMSGMITHTCPDCSVLAKPPSKIKNGWVITCQKSACDFLFMLQLDLIHVCKRGLELKQ